MGLFNCFCKKEKCPTQKKPHKLYGAIYSTCTRRVLMTAVELGVEIELVMVDLLKGDHKSPEHMKRQPFGQIPAFEDSDDGTIIFESRAICRYLATKYRKKNPHLLPSDLKQYTMVETWCSVELSNWDPSIAGIVLEEVFKPGFFNAQPDPKMVASHVKKIGPFLDVYDKVLSERKYLAGDHMSLVDIFHIPYGFLILTATSQKELIQSRPNLKRWFESLTESESWKKICAM